MRGPSWFGVVRVIAVLAVIGIVAVVAYNVGVSAGLASVGSAAGSVPYVPWGYGFGFGGFGFLIPIVIIVLLVAAFARPRPWAGRGGWGPGGWASGDVPPGAEPMLQAWHRRAHGESTPDRRDAPTNEPIERR